MTQTTKFSVLSKQETKEMEWSTTPILNHFHDYLYDWKYRVFGRRKKAQVQFDQIHRATWDNKVPDNLWKEIAFFSEKFGSRPLYYVDYEYRNGVWGFAIDDTPVIIYWSKRGFSCQVPREFSAKQFNTVINWIHEKVVK